MFDFRIGRGPDPDFRTGLGGNLEVSQLFHSGWPLVLARNLPRVHYLQLSSYRISDVRIGSELFA